MYFNLPKSNERQNILNKKTSNSSIMSTDSSTSISTADNPNTVGGISIIAEDRISEIIHNLDDHWGSPPILTPNTLAHILNHQWINTTAEENEEFKKKVSCAVSKSRNKSKNNNTSTTNTTTAIIDKKLISNLIKEFCKTIQEIDTENKFEVTKDLKNDPMIQKYLISSSSSSLSSSSSSLSSSSTPSVSTEDKEVIEDSNNVLEHMLELLQHRNDNKQNKKVEGEKMISKA